MHVISKIPCYGIILLPISVATFDSINQIEMTKDIAM